MDTPTIFFMFAGRRGNLELNLPMIRRILDEHPNVEFHLWNLARIQSDCDYINSIDDERIVACQLYSGRAAYRHMARVWQHYTHPRFKDCRFVKIDDDVVFLETERFGSFLDAVEVNPEFVVSANVVNNGACTPLTPGLWNGFTDLDIPLLDVHESNAYAEMAHEYFLEHWLDMLEQPVELVQTEEWLSINLIGMHWPMLCKIAAKLGTRAPREIAGRLWEPSHRVGDEGAVNMFPRALVRGFAAAHLGFGPQKLTAEQEDDWRSRYAKINQTYLGGWVTDWKSAERVFG
jgi:hypothetical protein